jgi:hypothetical protein
MIHIATVHHNTAKWIDLQLFFIQQNVSAPYRTYAFLSGEALAHKDRFNVSVSNPITDHASRLNYLASLIVNDADDKDIIIFIDGDAFPVAPIDSLVQEVCNKVPMAAIQRVENLLDIQPHPSFCITTVSFWKEVGGDWSAGYKWDTPAGRITDVGGNLLGVLVSQRKEWMPLHRSQSVGSHPLLFGVYNNCIYHHGAGFRTAHTRSDLLIKPESLFARLRYLLIPKWLSIKVMYRLHWLLRLYPVTLKRNTRESEYIFSRIAESREDFFNSIIADSRNP